jgi:hypothetical protein
MRLTGVAVPQYKSRIEADKRMREEALALEREEAEKKLREKMREEVDRMEVQLKEEQSKAEAEFQRKRNQVITYLIVSTSVR